MHPLWFCTTTMTDRNTLRQIMTRLEEPELGMYRTKKKEHGEDYSVKNGIRQGMVFRNTYANIHN